MTYIEFLENILEHGFATTGSACWVSDRSDHEKDIMDILTLLGLVGDKDVVVLTEEQRKKLTELKYAALLGVD